MHKNAWRFWHWSFTYVLSLGVLIVLWAFLSAATNASPGINQQLNFQGRLFNSQGATVADGYYNVEFKIYQDGDGQSVETTGSPLGSPDWTESHLNANSQGVTVKNGFLSVELGSVTAFGSSIDWNQDTLWLSINIGDTNASCTPFSSCNPDGEMLPMKRLSSTPFSLNSGMLNGKTSNQFLQLAQGVQEDASTNTSSIFINKTGTGNLIELQASSTDVYTVTNSGDITFGNNANHAISVTTASNDTAGKSLTISSGAAGTGAAALAGGDLLIQGGNGGGTNGNGGNVSIDAGTKNGTGADGSINIGTSTASTIQIGSTTMASGSQTINVGNNNTSGGTTNVTIGSGSSATAGTTTVQSKGNMTLTSSNGTMTLTSNSNMGLSSTGGTMTISGSGNTSLSSSAGTLSLSGNGNTSLTSTAGTLGLGSSGNTILSTNGVTRATIDTSNDLYLGNGVTAAAPNDFTVSGTGSTTTGVAGGSINIQGGNATVGNANGGNVAINAGTLAGSGSDGSINIGTSHGSTIQIGSANLATGTQTVNIGNNNTAGSTTNVVIGSGPNATAGTTTVRAKGDLTLNSSNGNTSLGASNGTMTISSSGNSSMSSSAGTLQLTGNGNTTLSSTTGTVGITSSGATTVGTNGNTRATFDTSYAVYFGAGVTGAVNPFTLSATGGTAGVAGSSLTVQGGTGGSSSTGGALTLKGGSGGSTSGAGGALTVQGGNATAGNSNGGDLIMNAGLKNGSGTDGNIYMGTANASNTIQIGNTTNAVTQNVYIGNNNTASSTTNVTIGSGSSAAGGSTTVQSKGNMSMTSSNGTITMSSNGSFSASSVAGTFSISGSGNVSLTSTAGTVGLASSGNTTVTTNGIVRGTFDAANGLYLGNGVTAAAPNNFTLSGTGSSTTAVSGSALTIQGGNATVGNANGGNVTVTGGTGYGTGVNGLVVLTTPTFSTVSNDANCYTGGVLVASSCTIAMSSVNNSSAVLVGFNTTSQTATMPDPTTSTAGRVIYITAANGSSDFTLSVNGGGTGNTIAMRQNTTATMIWNGTDWTAAGASSSTTLQSAYDNTLQSAGGAELVVSHTSTTNGLTIRDSSVSPVNGTLLSIQTSSAAGLLSVNSNVTEYSSDSGAEVAGASSSVFPSNTWSTVAGSTISRYTTVGNFISTGQASVSVTTSTSANSGVKNTLTSSLTANTTYNVSFTTRLSSGTFTDLNVYYSIDGSAASVECTSSKAANTSIWTKVNCTFTAPSSGITSNNAIFIRQTGSGTSRTFYVDNLSVTIAADYNYATDGSVNDGASFSTNWAAVSSASVSRSTTVGYDASDSAQVTTTGNGQGVRNKLSVNPLPGTLYRITVYASSSSSLATFTVRYSRDGGTNFVSCVDYNTQTISTPVSDFTKVTCYVTTDSSSPTNTYVYFTQSDATARTFHVDAFSMTLSSNSVPNVQIGSGINGGPVTLLTLDRGASAPIASDNDALLGSMYYDTSLGKLQCYEADGWGACGSSPDNVITISPEFTNAVMHGTGVGTMTSDLCSDTLNINDGSSSQPTICGSNETYNFYKWTSPQPSAQTYGIYVTYQLPSTFKEFVSGETSLMGRTDSSNATVQYQIYRNDASTGLISCGSAIAVSTGSQASWQIGVASGAADPSTCSFAAGNSIVFKISVTASQNANSYIGNLNFIFSNR